MTLFLFAVQVASGILLLLYYRPSASEAFESVQFIVTQVEFGWLVRNVHSWSANLLILAAFAHLFSVFFLKSYRKPRELTWVSGALLLFLMLGFGFSGYLLPWNELAFFATKVGTGIAGAVPVIGPGLMRFLRGGEDVTGATLSRFYALHVAILPAATTVLVALHLLLRPAAGHERAHQGSAPPPRRRDRPGTCRSFPITSCAMCWCGTWRWRCWQGWRRSIRGSLGRKADPFAAVPAGIRPEWYFLATFHTLKILPSHVLGIEGEQLGVLAFGLAAILLVAVPFLDRRASRDAAEPVRSRSLGLGGTGLS